MGGVFFSSLFFILTVVGLWEFYNLINKNVEGVEIPIALTVVGGAATFGSVCLLRFGELDGVWNALNAVPFLVVSIIMVVELFRNKQKPALNIAYSLMGLLYIALPFSLLAIVESFGVESPIEDSMEIGSRLVLAFFIIIWASDTGAYLVGMLIGKHKMFERISPKKTWEGLFGGMLFALLCGVAFSQLEFFPPYTMLSWIGCALLIFAFGVVGDLVESLIKRDLGVKDSGKFLPGHGGLLDRFDSALIAAPALFLITMLLKVC